MFTRTRLRTTTARASARRAMCSTRVAATRLPPYVLAPAFESLEAGLDEGCGRLSLQKLEALQGHAQKSDTNGQRDEHYGERTNS